MIKFYNMVELNKEIKKKLQSFYNLGDNWDEVMDFYPPHKSKKEKCLNFLDLLTSKGIEVYNTSHGKWGEVSIEILSKSSLKSIDFIFYEGEDKYVKYESNGDLVFCGEYGDPILDDLLNWFLN